MINVMPALRLGRRVAKVAAPVGTQVAEVEAGD